MMVDVKTKTEFMDFLLKAKDLSMMKAKYHFILVGLVRHFGLLAGKNILIGKLCVLQNANELELNNFDNGGANITGYSLVDYYNHNTLKLLNKVLDLKVPINKIKTIPVSILLIPYVQCIQHC